MNTIARVRFAGALLACLFWLPVASAAQAAPFQDYRNGACGSGICNINFAPVPSGRRLDISNVSCYLRVSQDADVYALQLLVAQGANISSAVTVVPQFVDSVAGIGDRVYSADHHIFAFANAGQRFRIYAELKGGVYRQLACTSAGKC
ncbi:MAG: hypothetical protein GEU91_16690 [Rhizobiales bacterium]|nr:hypothetical protein [Hyphomicrobiales bacterium]